MKERLTYQELRGMLRGKESGNCRHYAGYKAARDALAYRRALRKVRRFINQNWGNVRSGHGYFTANAIIDRALGRTLPKESKR